MSWWKEHERTPKRLCNSCKKSSNRIERYPCGVKISVKIPEIRTSFVVYSVLLIGPLHKSSSRLSGGHQCAIGLSWCQCLVCAFSITNWEACTIWIQYDISHFHVYNLILRFNNKDATISNQASTEHHSTLYSHGNRPILEDSLSIRDSRLCSWTGRLK